MDDTTLLLALAPIFGIDLILKIVALYSLGKRETTRGPKWLWVVVIVFVNLFGWAIYFLFARDEK